MNGHKQRIQKLRAMWRMQEQKLEERRRLDPSELPPAADLEPPACLPLQRDHPASPRLLRQRHRLDGKPRR